MPTQQYKDKSGKRVPGTTTVIGRNLGWSAEGLKIWANREGLAGRDITDWNNRATQAATIGTVVHDMIEATIHEQDVDAVLTKAKELRDKDNNPLLSEAHLGAVDEGYTSFRRWRAGSTLEVVATEVWGVDEGFRTGFCADAIALEPDLDDPTVRNLTLLDWKTSKGTYADHVIQVACYVVLIERLLNAGGTFKGGQIRRPEAFEGLEGSGFRFSGAHVLRVDKENGMFSHKHWSRKNLEEAWTAFTWLRGLHDMRPRLEALCK